METFAIKYVCVYVCVNYQQSDQSLHREQKK